SMKASAVDIVNSAAATFRNTRLTTTRRIRACISLLPGIAPSRSRLRHRLGGEEFLVDRAHVDVPALMLRGLDAGQIAHGGLSRLQIGRNRSNNEFTLERIDCDPCIRHWTVTIGEELHLSSIKLATLIVSIDVRRVHHLRIQIEHGFRIELTAGLTDYATRRSFHDVHVSHLPRL